MKPRAGKDEIQGGDGLALVVKLKAPPVDGAANEALLAFLAKRLRVSRASLEILHGGGSPHKLLRAHGLTSERVLALVEPTTRQTR